MWKKIKTRLLSPVVWLSVVGQVCVIVALFRPDITDTIKIITTSLVECLTLFGILNNPSDKENF